MESEQARPLDWILEFLTDDDDLHFWQACFAVLRADAESLIVERGTKHEIFMQIGACSHWLRPHQTRWSAEGGFAWPTGYEGDARLSRQGLPELDWQVLIRWESETRSWSRVEKFTGKQKLVMRCALPTRTAQHPQAAVHTFWSLGTPDCFDSKLTRFYGFRKKDDEWRCVAAHDLPRP